MANITLLGASYTDVPAVDLPQTGGGTVRFYENGGGETTANHWQGKTWYGYGTSITNTASEGKYPTYLAQMSGMTFVNKGISGGGIGNLGGYSQGQVYSAICNITDGKLNADLITLETGANDIDDVVPLGTIYDTGTSTLSGCLNDCLRYLQANTTAQIVVFPSPTASSENPSSQGGTKILRMVENGRRNLLYKSSPVH